MVENNNDFNIPSISNGDPPLEIIKYLFPGYNIDENDFDCNGDFIPLKNSFKKTGLIASILEDWLDPAYEMYGDKFSLYRPNAYDELKKVINCFNKKLGFATFECPECHELYYVSCTCKSRSCSSCGYKYKIKIVDNIMNKVYDVNHRQMVFTIPKELRIIFFKHFKKAINILFEAVNLTINSIINVKYKTCKGKIKKKKYINKLKKIPGFIAFLHTFGRDLKFNPHIHVLIAEMLLDKNGNQHKCNYFNYEALSRRFQKYLLDLLFDAGLISKSDISKQYANHQKGLYVYAEAKHFDSIKDGVEYIARYCSRLPISENRIIGYDGENVTFSYNAHEDDSYHEVTITALEFITMLIRHIIPTQFKTIRYYGFYKKKYKNNENIFNKLIKFVKENKSHLSHENLIVKFFNRNPYYCPSCNKRLEFVIMVT